MAGAKPGVHVVTLKPVLVPASLTNGSKFVKWDDDSANGQPIVMRVDPKGYIVYWTDQNKEMDCLEISFIRDTRTGKYARIPKDSRLRESFSALGPQDCPLEDRMLTICYGADMVNVSFINFLATSKESAQEWADGIFKYAVNLLTLNCSPMRFLEKCHTKLSLIQDPDGKIPVRNIAKMFAQHKDDRKRIQKALEQARLPAGINDRLDHLSIDDFFSFYYHLCGRQEVDAIFAQFGNKQTSLMTAEQFMSFLNQEQRDPRLNEILYPYCDLAKAHALISQFEPSASSAEASGKHGHLSKQGFLRYLLSDENGIIPLEKLDLNEDMTQPLSHYFINSSHNTYLTGHQLTGKSSIEIYRQTLLTGCRCVELDCWDGKGIDEEPIITHGFTMCTEISLKEVIEAIAETAFKVSDYPVILSFENHCSPKQQAKIACLCRTVFADALLTDPLDSYPLEADVPLPSPESLKRKILIKNKKRHLHKCTAKPGGDGKQGEASHQAVHSLPSNSSTGAAEGEAGGAARVSDDGPTTSWVAASEAAAENTDSDSELGEEPELLDDEAGKIHEVPEYRGTEGQEAEAGMEMSALVNYIQPARFHSFDYAEKRNRSYECTSFVETQATAFLKAFPVEFVNFNKRQISRIYPKGTRVDSSNYMPQIFWNAGCHLVALNFQTLDLPMQLNLGTFEYNGRTGYILKPDFMRRKDRQFDPFAESTVDGIVAGTVEVKVISGQFLTDRKIGTYVEVDMYGLPTDTVRRKFRTKVFPANGINPVYDEEPFVFRKVVLPNLATLRLAVYHENGTTMIGHRVLPVEGLRPGYRHIGLRNESNQPQGAATLFVHISVRDYIPDAFADFAAALVNPIAYQSSLDKHAQQLAILEEEFDSNKQAVESSPKCEPVITCESSPIVLRHPSVTNKKSAELSFSFRRLGSMTTKILSPDLGQTMHLSESPSNSQGGSRSLSIPSGSPLHGMSLEAAGQKIDVSITSHLLDPELLEPVSLSLLRQNKQFLKLVARSNKDFDALRRKNEKARSLKLQTHRTELDRVAATHAKTLATIERTQNKSRTSDGSFKNAALIKDHEALVQATATRHRNEMLALCQEQLRLELDAELSAVPLQRAKLEQLVSASRENHLARLSKIYEKEVAELKKRIDSQNWEEMKTLAKRHKDKNELARVRREAMQKYINLAVQERQKLKDIHERCTADVQSVYSSLAEQVVNSHTQMEDQLRRSFEEKWRSAVDQYSASVCNGSPGESTKTGSLIKSVTPEFRVEQAHLSPENGRKT